MGDKYQHRYEKNALDVLRDVIACIEAGTVRVECLTMQQTNHGVDEKYYRSVSPAGKTLLRLELYHPRRELIVPDRDR